jgi:hypothetical protein
MKTAKEQWIDEVLDSTAGMHRAEPGAGLLDGVYRKLQIPKVIPFVPVQKVWLAAASIILLLSVNIFVLKRQGSMRKDPAQSLINAYGFSSDPYGGLFDEGGNK